MRVFSYTARDFLQSFPRLGTTISVGTSPGSQRWRPWLFVFFLFQRYPSPSRARADDKNGSVVGRGLTRTLYKAQSGALTKHRHGWNGSHDHASSSSSRRLQAATTDWFAWPGSGVQELEKLLVFFVFCLVLFLDCFGWISGAVDRLPCTDF